MLPSDGMRRPAITAMTTHSHIIRNTQRPALYGRRFEIRWNALHGAAQEASDAARRSCFTIALEPVNEQHALLECSLLRGESHRTILPRQTVSCHIVEDGALTHVDVSLEGRRLLAVTIRDESQLLYAQSPLAAEAGLPPGTCDPATLVLPHIRHDAVSA